MKKLLLVSFILASSLTFADQANQAKHQAHKAKHQTTYETDEYDEDYVVYKGDDLLYDWNQNEKNTKVVFSIGNADDSKPVTLKYVKVVVGDETCVDETFDTAIQPRKQIRIDSLATTKCFDIRRRVKYVDAVNLAAGTPRVKPDTITKDAVVSVNYIDKNGANTQRTSTFRVSFFPTAR